MNVLLEAIVNEARYMLSPEYERAKELHANSITNRPEACPICRGDWFRVNA